MLYERKNFWKEASTEEVKRAFDFAVPYKDFLNKCKTERETVQWTEELLKASKFKSLPASKQSKRVYSVFRNKTIAMAVLGSEPLSAGFNMVAAHIDAPRVDLKQNPLYEDKSSNRLYENSLLWWYKEISMGFHSFGTYGIIIRTDGTILNISIGENEDEPVFIIPDLLPHLARKEQYTKTLGEAISASNMNLIFQV